MRLSHRLYGAIAALVVTLLLMAGDASALFAQQSTQDTDSALVRGDYRDINELLQKLPNPAPPSFDKVRAVELGAIQLSCIDRLQPMMPQRRTPAATPRESRDRDRGGRHVPGNVSDSSERANNSGTGYLWVTSYSLVPNNNQTRAFWGCTDWHSAVSSTWATVELTRDFPGSALQDLSREKLADHLGASNLQGELTFFHAAAASINPIPWSGQRPLFERPYGFAWLLKLESDLYTWPDSAARKWSANVMPLARWMSDSLGAYLDALPEPARDGSRNNTAFSMMLAFDYSDATGDMQLHDRLVSNARRFYARDTGCKTRNERVTVVAPRDSGVHRIAAPDTGPNDLSSRRAIAAATAAATRAARLRAGDDVVSPCLTEAALMSRVLAPSEFAAWLDAFLPPVQSARFAPLTEPAGGNAEVPQAQRSHFSGLSFERAQSMERVAHALPATDPRVAALRRLSAIQAQRGFDLMRGNVDGISWLPAYALLYVEARGAR